MGIFMSFMVGQNLEPVSSWYNLTSLVGHSAQISVVNRSVPRLKDPYM